MKPVKQPPANGSKIKSFFLFVHSFMKKSGRSYGNLAGCGVKPYSLLFIKYESFEFVFDETIIFAGMAPPLSFRNAVLLID